MRLLLIGLALAVLLCLPGCWAYSGIDGGSVAVQLDNDHSTIARDYSETIIEIIMPGEFLPPPPPARKEMRP
ncbi:MAG: hypothetical protein IMZ50_05525 [Candidatus Atribacteria bacterium]|nr:hypothetical protein [Candidatus Atribacteria bacterium]